MTTTTPAPTAAFLSVKAAQARYGLSRTRLYRLLAAGRIEARKLGGRTLVVAESADRFMAALPRAEFRGAPEAEAA